MWSDNPIFLRYARTQFRSRNLWSSLAIYGAAVLVIALVSLAPCEFTSSYSIHEAARRAFRLLLVLECFILLLWAPYRSGATLRNEIAARSYDFFRMLPLSARDKTLGIVVGRNLLPILLALVTILPLTFAAHVAGLSLVFLAELLAAVVALSALFCLAMLMVSTGLSERRLGIGSIDVLLVAPLMAMLWMLGVGFMAVAQIAMHLPNAMQHARHNLPFFTIPMPDLLLTALLALVATAWAYCGALRRFTKEREPLYSTGGLIGLMATWLVCVLGFYWPNIQVGTLHPLGIMWCVASLPLFMLPIGAMRDRDDYIEETRRTKTSLLRLIVRSNPAILLPTLMLWLAFIAATSCAAPELHRVLVYTAVNVASSWLFLVFLLEIHVLYGGTNDRLSALIGVAALLFLVLPPAIAMLLKDTALASLVSCFSILGFWLHYSDDVLSTGNCVWPTVYYNLFLCGLALLPILRRYRQILSWRAEMSRGT